MVKPSRANEYVPRDQLFLFWLAEPERPVLVGELNMVRSLRGVSLRYAEGWLERGFPLSEDLPLSPGQEFLPRPPRPRTTCRAVSARCPCSRKPKPSSSW